MSVEIKWEWDDAPTKQLLRMGEVHEFVRRKTDDVLNAAIRLAPVDDGVYRAGLTSDVKAFHGRPVGRVTATAPHSWLVEYGSAPRFRKVRNWGGTGATGSMPALAVLRRALAEAGSG